MNGETDFLEKLQKIFEDAFPKTKGQRELFIEWSKNLEEKNGEDYLEKFKNLLIDQWKYIKEI